MDTPKLFALMPLLVQMCISIHSDVFAQVKKTTMERGLGCKMETSEQFLSSLLSLLVATVQLRSLAKSRHSSPVSLWLPS